MQACAEHYALTYLITSELQLAVSQVVGLTAKFKHLILSMQFLLVYTVKSKSTLCYYRLSISLSVSDPWPDFYYCHILVDLLMWGALSDEGTSL
jgi:hypothetical protein